MHEYSLVQSLLDRVEAEARSHGASSVRKIRLTIGDLSGVEVDLFRSAYELFRERTVCRAADLEVTPVAARWECPRCQRRIANGAFLRCSDCDRPATLVAGDEIGLDRIEMEVA